MKSIILPTIIFIILFAGGGYIVRDKNIPIFSQLGRDISINILGEKEGIKLLTETETETETERDMFAKKTILDGLDSIKSYADSARNETVKSVYLRKYAEAKREADKIKENVSNGMGWYDAAIKNDFFRDDVKNGITLQDSFNEALVQKVSNSKSTINGGEWVEIPTEDKVHDNNIKIAKANSNIELCSGDPWKVGQKFIDNLKTCNVFKCEYSHPFAPDKMMFRSILGLDNNSSCLYEEKMLGGAFMTCAYSDIKRFAAAEYYNKLDNGTDVSTNINVTFTAEGSENNSIQTVDKKVLEMTLDDFLQDGTCNVTGI